MNLWQNFTNEIKFKIRIKEIVVFKASDTILFQSDIGCLFFIASSSVT